MSGVPYQCSPDIVWVKDAGQTLLVDRRADRSWLLHDAEAVIWDLLTVGYSYEKTAQMMALVLSLSKEQAERTLSGVLADWRHAGILRSAG